MKKAILVLLSEDRRTGRPLGDVQPYSDAAKEFKRVVSSGDCPDPELPRLELWVPGGKSHRFKVADPPPVEEEVSSAPVEEEVSSAPVEEEVTAGSKKRKH